ncbi:MAG: zf-TFIIB domain-containing protein [Dongiaceae bacterium]
MRKCPDDQVDLIATERQGIEIDYCPKCRGLWLDRGELDKIVERSGGAARAEQARLEGFAPEATGDPRALKITELFDF